MRSQIKQLMEESLFDNNVIIRSKLKKIHPDLEIWHDDNGNCIITDNEKIITKVKISVV
jgi:hypothetical protein